MPAKNKTQLIEWFSQMGDVEKSAKDMYFGIADNPAMTDEEIKKSFREISQDEDHHGQIVQQIINIMTNSL